MAVETEQLTQDGQEVQQYDFNKVATEAAHAEDYVFAEMLRLAPYNGSSYARLILPYGPALAASPTNGSLIQAANGGIVVMPFRAIIGSRAGISAYSPPTGAPALLTGQSNPNAIGNYRDIRSCLYVPTDDNVHLGHTQSISAGSGSPRIDLVYATLTIDQSSPTLSRQVQAPTAGATPSPTPVSTQLIQTVTISVVTGTPASTPTPPAVPADTPGSGVFQFPLCYVMVPTTFSGSTSTQGLIQVCAPCVSGDGRVTGAMRLRPATALTDDVFTGSNTLAAALGAWAAGTAPSWPLPSSMLGGEALLVAARWAAPAAPNLADGQVVDFSIDWRGRAFFWLAQVALPGEDGFTFTAGYLSPSAPNGNVNNGAIPGSLSGSATSGAPAMILGGGQSFGVDDTAAKPGLALGSTRTSAVACALTSAQSSLIPSGQAFGLLVNMTSGNLTAYSTLTNVNFPGGLVFIWLFASAQMDNNLF